MDHSPRFGVKKKQIRHQPTLLYAIARKKKNTSVENNFLRSAVIISPTGDRDIPWVILVHRDP